MTKFTILVCMALLLALIAIPVSDSACADEPTRGADTQEAADTQSEKRDWIEEREGVRYLVSSDGSEVELADCAWDEPDRFPSHVCFNELVDITLSGTIPELYEGCSGNATIVVRMVIWERDFLCYTCENVAEANWTFPTGGSTTDIPFAWTFEDIDLGYHIDEDPGDNGEFWIMVSGDCFATCFSLVEEVTLVDETWLTAPTLTSPTEGANVDIPVAFDWEDLTGADQYRIQVAQDNSFIAPEIDATVVSSSYLTDGLQTNTTYYWRVQGHNDCGWCDWSSSERDFTAGTTDADDPDDSDLPNRFTVHQNYPNPFNAQTSIEFVLPQASRVSIDIYNVAGTRVKNLLDEDLPAGRQTVTWDGRNDSRKEVSSGIYLYRIAAGEFTDARKMVLLK